MTTTQPTLFPTDSDYETPTRELSVDDVWHRVFTVAPLVIVGSKDTDGTYDLAPKHMAMPLGWGRATASSARRGTGRTGTSNGTAPSRSAFPVVPDRAGRARRIEREPDGTKPALAALPTFPAREVDGVLVHGCYAFLECELERFVELDDASLVIGRIVAASAVEEAIRDADGDDAELLRHVAPLAYLNPTRFAAIDEIRSFPFPASFSR